MRNSINYNAVHVMTWKHRLREYKNAKCNDLDDFNNYWENHSCSWCRNNKRLEWDWLCESCSVIKTARKAVDKFRLETKIVDWETIIKTKRMNMSQANKAQRNLANRWYLYFLSKC